MARVACKEETRIEKLSGVDGTLVKQKSKSQDVTVQKQECIALHSTAKKREDIPVILPSGYIKIEPVVAMKTGEDILIVDSNIEAAESSWVEEEVIDYGYASSSKASEITQKGIRKNRDRGPSRKKEYAKQKEHRERLRELSEGRSGAEAEAARKELAEFKRKQKLKYTNRRAKLARTRELAANGSGVEAERAREIIAEKRRKKNLYARTQRQRDKEKAVRNAIQKGDGKQQVEE